jgi:archaeosine synthase beta-subunit
MFVFNLVMKYLLNLAFGYENQKFSKKTMAKDKTKPLFHWYVDSAYGKELVFALYTKPCRYGRCTFCSLPEMSEGGETVSAADIEKQIDYILGNYTKEQLNKVAKISVYTASSALDQECLPTRSLMYMALKVSYLPKLEVFSLETRPEYVEDWELKALQNVLGEKVQLEVGIGYETHDLELRNKVLGKGLTTKALHRLLKMLAENKTNLKAYLMLKPHPSLSEEDGIVEAQNGVQEIADLGKAYDVPVSVHMNPTYIAEGCDLTNEMLDSGFKPPELTSVIKVVEFASHLKMPIYVGLDDEGQAVEGGTFRSTGLDKEKTVKAILGFNRHQDFKEMMKEIGASTG